MRRARSVGITILAITLGTVRAAPAAAQAGDSAARAAAARAASHDTAGHKPKKAKPRTRFFDTEEPLPVTFTANLGRLRKDRSDKAPWRPAALSYAGAGGAPVTVPVEARTRGIWRLKECAFPPLRLNFAGKATAGTVFEGLDKPKLVNYCRDSDDFEQYVLQELQLYRIHALLTPVSHKTRLLRMTYVDGESKKAHTTRYAFVLEEPKAVAARIGGEVIEGKGASAADFDAYNAALVGVFQYLIGNSDWSTSERHNAEIVRDSAFNIFLVPYDFDFAGAVDARYAVPDARLPIRTVRQRIYRGHCASADDYARVFALFNEKKDAIYGLYGDEIGRLLKPAVVKQTLGYFDDFYRTINSPRQAKRDIVDACFQRQ